MGPGHVDVVTDDSDQDWMIYHAAPRGNAVLPGGVQRRYMMLDRLDWVPVTGTDGTWPVVGNGTPSTARPAVPEVTLPVRLTARGDVTVGGAGVAGGAGIGGGDDEVLGLSVQIDSTGTDYSGQLTAAITGPGKHRRTLPFVTGEGPDVPAVPVSVLSGDSVERALTLRTGAPLAPGRYELVVSIGQAGGPGPGGTVAAQELAVFGLEVADDGSLSLGSGALGSASLGSASLGSASLGQVPFGSVPFGS